MAAPELTLPCSSQHVSCSLRVSRDLRKSSQCNHQLPLPFEDLCSPNHLILSSTFTVPPSPGISQPSESRSRIAIATPRDMCKESHARPLFARAGM